MCNRQLQHARRVAVAHLPQPWPQGNVCRGCGCVFPCASTGWAFGVLKAMRWELSDLFDLLELAEANDR
jgi:hypothetical protein